MTTIIGLGVAVVVVIPVAAAYAVRFTPGKKPKDKASASSEEGESPYTLTADAVEFFPPQDGGGKQLNNSNNGYGEPLNVIISALSDPEVLTDDGFVDWAQSIGFDHECLYQHRGDPQAANLGDGNGWVNQTVELRQDYGGGVVGTCFESLMGGNHLRMYRQNGLQANSGALFLAVSDEEPLSKHHTISPDGYNTGRDKLVKAATAGTTHEMFGKSYTATKRVVTGLLPPGTEGVNHGIATDGNVILLTVKIVK